MAANFNFDGPFGLVGQNLLNFTLLYLTFPTLGETNLLTAYLHGSNTNGTSTQ
jgi:hypothetical protein